MTKQFGIRFGHGVWMGALGILLPGAPAGAKPRVDERVSREVVVTNAPDEPVPRAIVSTPALAPFQKGLVLRMIDGNVVASESFGAVRGRAPRVFLTTR